MLDLPTLIENSFFTRDFSRSLMYARFVLLLGDSSYDKVFIRKGPITIPIPLCRNFFSKSSMYIVKKRGLRTQPSVTLYDTEKAFRRSTNKRFRFSAGVQASNGSECWSTNADFDDLFDESWHISALSAPSSKLGNLGEGANPPKTFRECLKNMYFG